MIVISGALVLVALVLLVIGLIGSTLTFVYASIAVSLASFAFLIIGIMQRREETLPLTAGEGVSMSNGDSAPGVSAVTAEVGWPVRAASPSDQAKGVTTLPAVYAPPVAAAQPLAAHDDGMTLATGEVLVVAGRPRYHVAGCRYLVGKDPEPVNVAAAREQGFTACGVCKPDAALAAAIETNLAKTDPTETAGGRADVAAALPVAVEEPALADRDTDIDSDTDVHTDVDTDVDLQTGVDDEVEIVAPVPVPAAVRATRTAPAKPAVKAATVPRAATVKAPVKAAPVKVAPVRAVPVRAAKATPASPAKKAPAALTKREGVIVIPAGGKFHTPGCRYVRGAEGTLELTKAAATKQGYDPCGVCNP